MEAQTTCATCELRHHEADARLGREVTMTVDRLKAARGCLGVVVRLVLTQYEPCWRVFRRRKYERARDDTGNLAVFF